MMAGRTLLAAMLLVVAPGAAAHEVFCGEKAGPLCTRWNARFAGGPVDSGQPDRQGTVTVDLAISPDGHVSGCTIARSSGNPDLDAETCTQLQAYAHYRPALDDDGRPTTGADSLTIEWVFHPREDPVVRSSTVEAAMP